MINIYVGKENLPKDILLVDNPENAIYVIDLSGTKFQRLVLEKVEHGSYKDTTMFTDRFGGNLYYSDMSTGSKSLFLLEGLPDKAINCVECGENAIRMFGYLKTCNIYLPHWSGKFSWDVDAPLMFNGKYYKSVGWLNEFL